MRLIDADALKEEFRNQYKVSFAEVMDEIIDGQPTIEPERKAVRGKWVYQGNQNFPYCSECMMPQDMPTNFCPSCGADMREVENGVSRSI